MGIKTYDVVELTAGIEEAVGGDYVRWEDVANWLRQQRNDIPMTGEEACKGFLYALNNLEN